MTVSSCDVPTQARGWNLRRHICLVSHEHSLMLHLFLFVQDNGDEFLYTGSGGRDLSGNKRTAEQSCDQKLTKMNRWLAREEQIVNGRMDGCWMTGSSPYGNLNCGAERSAGFELHVTCPQGPRSQLRRSSRRQRWRRGGQVAKWQASQGGQWVFTVLTMTRPVTR